MKLVTWNVNSVRARLTNITEFLDAEKPDIIGLQELKCQDEQFPLEAFEELGYNVSIFGQKSYNGVALLSKYPLNDVVKGIPHFEDEQSRFIAADVQAGEHYVHIINCYMPNGNPVPSEKYDYKLRWMRALNDYVRNLRHHETPFILCGDFNIIPDSYDVHDPIAWEGDSLYREESIRFYHELLHMGLTDTVRYFNPNDPSYSFWDYQGRAREKNHGIRIDHILPSPDIMDLAVNAYVIDSPRDAAKASDHAPVMFECAA